MSEIIERVARAICRTNIADVSCVMDDHPDRPPCDEKNCMMFTAARAAIEAMFDPTPAMIDAGSLYFPHWNRDAAVAIWHAMMDVARSEGSP